MDKFNDLHTMSTKGFKSAIDGLMQTACDTAFTLSVEQIIAFIKQVIECICAELLANGKSPVVSSEEAYAIAEEIYLDEEDGELSEDIEFINDKDALTSIFDNLNTILTVKDYKRDSKMIVDQLMSDERFAYTFLYGYSQIPGRSIARLRSRIKNTIRKSYHIELSDETISTVIYEHLWDEGEFTPLKSYNYKSTFFQWLSTVASHAVMKYLEENGFIKVNRERTPGNVRIIWKDKKPECCQMMLDEMIHIPRIHAFLTALYVDRKSQEEIQKELDLDEKDYKLTKRASEKSLKVALLSTENCYEDFLADKGARKLMVSSEFLTLIGKTNANEISDSPLREVLGVSEDDANFEAKVEEFLYDFSNKLFTKELDKTVWQGRFIKGITPKDMAEMLGKTRGWVDCKFNRTNTRFKEAAIAWWNKMTKTPL